MTDPRSSLAHNVSSSSKGRASGEVERTEVNLELRARLLVLGWPLRVVKWFS